MAFQNDWVLRQVESIVQFAAQVLFQKDRIDYVLEQKNAYTNSELVYLELRTMLGTGEIGKAEDLLFQKFENTEEYLKIAVDFYERLNLLSDQTLEEANFSRAEIGEGLQALLKRAGVSLLGEK